MGSESSGSQSFFANMAVDVEQFPGGARGRSAVSNFERGVFDPTLKFDPGGFSAHFGLSRGT